MDKLKACNISNDFISLNYRCDWVKGSHALKVMKNVSNDWTEAINFWPNTYCFTNNQKLGKRIVVARESVLSSQKEFPYTATLSSKLQVYSI